MAELTRRSELPFYCFQDGQPKAKKKVKRGQPNVSQTMKLWLYQLMPAGRNGDRNGGRKGRTRTEQTIKVSNLSEREQELT